MEVRRTGSVKCKKGKLNHYEKCNVCQKKPKGHKVKTQRTIDLGWLGSEFVSTLSPTMTEEELTPKR